MITKECRTFEDIKRFFQQELILSPLASSKVDYDYLAKEFLRREFNEVWVGEEIMNDVGLHIGISMNHAFLVAEEGGI